MSSSCTSQTLNQTLKPLAHSRQRFEFLAAAPLLPENPKGLGFRTYSEHSLQFISTRKGNPSDQIGQLLWVVNVVKSYHLHPGPRTLKPNNNKPSHHTLQPSLKSRGGADLSINQYSTLNPKPWSYLIKVFFVKVGSFKQLFHGGQDLHMQHFHNTVSRIGAAAAEGPRGCLPREGY